MRRDSKAVHGGRSSFVRMGVHAAPLDRSTTYPVTNTNEGIASLDGLAEGRLDVPNPIYARLQNPTVDRFEQAFGSLEGSEAAVAFASGMAAVSACMLAVKDFGNHIIAVRPVYGTSDHLLASGLLGFETTFTTPDAIADHIRPETALIFIETPANPTLQLVSIAEVSKQAGEIPVVVDSTFATPVLQRPLEHGASMVLHSATKFIGGHGDVMAGIVATSEKWARKLRQVRLKTGGILAPDVAYMAHRGLQTLHIRVERAQENAQKVADWLQKHPMISRLYYPGMMGDAQKEIMCRQMSGPGSNLSFDVIGGFDTASTVMQSVAMITPAVSLGSVDSLIQHPAGLTHRVVDPEAKKHMGISDGMLRLSVGIEAVEDIIADLEQALEKAKHLLAKQPTLSNQKAG